MKLSLQVCTSVLTHDAMYLLPSDDEKEEKQALFILMALLFKSNPTERLKYILEDHQVIHLSHKVMCEYRIHACLLPLYMFMLNIFLLKLGKVQAIFVPNFRCILCHLTYSLSPSFQCYITVFLQFLCIHICRLVKILLLKQVML